LACDPCIEFQQHEEVIHLQKAESNNQLFPKQKLPKMKTILFIAAVLGSLLAGCNLQPGFTVNGTTEEVTEGKAYLITLAYDARGGDTLAVAPVTDGKFTLKGKVEEVQLASIVVEGTKNRIRPIFIENGTFTVTIGKSPVFEGNTLAAPGTPSKIEGGGAVQQVYSQFFAIRQESDQRGLELRGAFFATEDATAKDSIRGLFSDLEKTIEAKEAEVVKANPDSYATAFYLYNKSATLGLDQLKEQLNTLGATGRATKYGKLIEERVQLLESVTIGQVAPDFRLATPEGDTISLHGIEAKLKLIDFWASWCGPCRGENPNVVKVYAEYHPKGLEIIGVSLDNDRDSWLKAIADDQLTWKHGSDLKGWQAAPAKLYGVNAIPHTVLLDENNTIIAKNLRGDQLKEKLAELLD
jgi:thiol-disulfide isomerase/thioredoxin